MPKQRKPSGVTSSTPSPSRKRLYRFAVIQDGIEVAGVDGYDKDFGCKEIMHYAMQYAADGDVTVKGKNVHSQAALIRHLGMRIRLAKDVEEKSSA